MFFFNFLNFNKKQKRFFYIYMCEEKLTLKELEHTVNVYPMSTKTQNASFYVVWPEAFMFSYCSCVCVCPA